MTIVHVLPGDDLMAEPVGTNDEIKWQKCGSAMRIVHRVPIGRAPVLKDRRFNAPMRIPHPANVNPGKPSGKTAALSAAFLRGKPPP